MTRPQPPPPAQPAVDPKTQADLDYLADTLAKAFNHAMSFGFTEGLKLNQAFQAMKANKAGPQVLAKALAIYCNTNPQAAAVLQLAAATSPRLAEILQRIGAVAKPAEPAP